jgi:hypothetical protein
MRPFRDVRRCTSSCRTRPVTPEVAGSSPVAPVYRYACKWHLGAFIGDYNGLAASDAFVYPVWTDGRNDAIGETGLGETDIFTNVENGG